MALAYMLLRGLRDEDDDSDSTWSHSENESGDEVSAILNKEQYLITVCA